MVGVPGTEHTYRMYITYSEYFAILLITNESHGAVPLHVQLSLTTNTP